MLSRFQYAAVLAALLLAGALSLAQPGATNSIEELLQQGQAELAAKEWRVAAATFRKTLQREPGNTTAYTGLGWSLCELGQFQEAVASLNKVLEIAPTNSGAHYHLALCYYKLEDFEHAASSFQQSLAADPTNADGHYWLSRSLSHLKRPGEAEAAIRKAINLGAAPARYYDRLGSCLSELSRNGEAISAYKQALSLDPNDTYALLRLGACYYHAEAYREAVAPLEKYVAAKPKDYYGFYYLGHSHFELRQFDRAARALQAAHELNPADVLTRLGLFGSYVATGQFEKAYGLYPFLCPAGGSLLVVGYGVGLAWMLVISFKRRGNVAPTTIATLPERACLQQQAPGECSTPPPVLPGFIASARAAAGDSRALAASDGDRANAWPGVWFSLGWMALFIAGQMACSFLLGFFAPFRNMAAALVGMGAASLPVVVAAGAGFTRQAWGAPFAWPRPLPPARILVISLLGLVLVLLFEAGFSALIEWITHKPFPVQVALPLIREALQTNPISVVASVVFLAPMAEEVLFRGLFFGALQRWLSARWTILLTAMLFSLIHVQAIYFLPIFLVGLLCGWSRHKSGSLAVPMLLHILNNGISLLLMRLFPEAT